MAAGCFSCFGRFSSRKGTRGSKQTRTANSVGPNFRDSRPHLMINRYGDESSELYMVRPLDGEWFSAPLLPNASGKVWCVGHKDGWIVTVHDLDITLFNPVSGAQVKFPRFYEMPGVDIKALPCVGKVVLSGTPGTGGVITAMALTRDSNIAYARSTDRNWTTIPVADDNSIRDFVYHNGQFCILVSGPVNWEDDDDDEDVVRSYRMSMLSMLSFDELGYTSLGFKYKERLEGGGVLCLASSPTNGLLLVVGIPEEHSAKYSRFKVMMFQPTERNKWVQVEDLGEHCLLVDAAQATLLPVANAAGLERNRVYLGGLFVNSANELVVVTGAFDIATGASEPCFPTTFPLETLRDVIPCWFTPILSGGGGGDGDGGSDFILF